MPGMIDKIIINSSNLMSFLAVLKGLFRGILITMSTSEEMTEEIHSGGWENDTEAQKLLADQVANCSILHLAWRTFRDALIKYHDDQIGWNERSRIFIDKKLKQANTP